LRLKSTAREQQVFHAHAPLFFSHRAGGGINAASSITSVRYLPRHANARKFSPRRGHRRRAMFLTCEIAGAIKALRAQ